MADQSTSIQTPYPIAHLPQPLDPVDGKTFFSNTYSLVGPKKRKRNEVAIATDGESVNIYDVQSPRLKTSYALSPQSKFTCPPCCIRRKSEKSQAAQTYIYCSVVEPRARIQLFSDNERAKPSPSTFPGAGTMSYPVPELSQPIFHIDVVPALDPVSGAQDVPDVIAVHHDGEIRLLSGSLGVEKWCTSIASLVGADDVVRTSTTIFGVEYAALLDAETAGKGLLKERADLRAMLGVDISTGSADTYATLLFVITSCQEHESSKSEPMTSHMFALQGNRLTRNNGGILGTSPSLQHMQSVPLPKHSYLESTPRQPFQILLHAPSGTLYLGSPNALRIYDLSGTVPELSSDIRMGQNGLSSFLRLSPSSIVAASSTSLAIHDTKYRSVQAFCPLNNMNAAKPKPEIEEAQKSPFQLLSYVAQLGLVLAKTTNDLLAFQVTFPYSILGSQRKRKRDGLLIDSIGRGLRESVAQSKFPSPTRFSLGSPLPSRTVQDTHWQEVMRSLDNDAVEERMDIFEAVMLLELGVTEDGQSSTSWSEDISDPAPSPNKKNHKALQGKSPPNRRATNNHATPDVAHRAKVLYILEKMFSFAVNEGQPARTATSSAGEASGLKVVFLPMKLFIWLVESGNFSASNVELALRRKSLSIVPPTLPVGALTEALVAYDPSLVSIMVLLRRPVYLEAEELAQLIKSMLRVLEAKERINGRLLTNGEGESVNGETEDMPQCGALAAGDDLESKHQGLSSLHRRALMAALRRLYSFPASTITKALKKQLNGSDTIRLIEELRIELSRGGWTSDPEFSSDLYDDQEHHEALHMLITLINCAVDNLGMGGWFLGASALDDSEDKADMLELTIAEISAVLQGVQEAAYLAGTLTQMLLYGKSVAAGTRANPAKGKDTTAIAKPVTFSLDTVDTRLLPPSLKAPQVIPLTKVGAGGDVQKRSARDIGRLKSKMVGKYSRERIIF